MVGGLKVGFFGLIGANAVQVTAQAAPLTFDPIAVAAARMVKELRETDQVDLVIALSHSGIDHTGQGEGAVLAAQVPGIDIIISGVAGLLGAVQKLTENRLQVTAKDSDCLTPVDPTTRFVDADPTTADVQELKHWQAVLKYVSGLPDADGDGVPYVPAAYASPQGRIVVQP